MCDFLDDLKLGIAFTTRMIIRTTASREIMKGILKACSSMDAKINLCVFTILNLESYHLFIESDFEIRLLHTVLPRANVHLFIENVCLVNLYIIIAH